MAKKNNEIENAAKKHVEENETEKGLGNVQDHYETTNEPKEKSKMGNKLSDGNKFGFIMMDLKRIPSQGLFYQPGTKIYIKAAEGAEIKHWSTIDETDPYDVDDKLNFIIERCVKIVIPNTRATHKDIMEIDRFWLVLAIHERTFIDGENKLSADVSNPKSRSSETEKVEVTHHVINYFDPSDSLMKFYNEEERGFDFSEIVGDEFKLYFPCVGVSNFLRKYREQKEERRERIDEDFAKYASFIFKDWRGLNDKLYKLEEQKSHGWSLKKTSVISSFVDKVKNSVNPTMTVEVGGEEVTVPLNFRGGLKAIFIIPDILG